MTCILGLLTGIGRLSLHLLRGGANIGANATIVCGVTTGKYAMVAAGAVVTKDVPPHGLVMGNPARLRVLCVIVVSR